MNSSTASPRAPRPLLAPSRGSTSFPGCLHIVTCALPNCGFSVAAPRTPLIIFQAFVVFLFLFLTGIKNIPGELPTPPPPVVVLGGGEWNKTAELRKEVPRGGQGRSGLGALGWRDGASSPRVATAEFPEVPQTLWLHLRAACLSAAGLRLTLLSFIPPLIFTPPLASPAAGLSNCEWLIRGTQYRGIM